jgi:CHAD domain-containing protein
VPLHTAVLARLEAFLPTMRAANDELSELHASDPASADIEHLSDPDAPHIEMVSHAPSHMLLVGEGP